MRNSLLLALLNSDMVTAQIQLAKSTKDQGKGKKRAANFECLLSCFYSTFHPQGTYLPSIRLCPSPAEAHISECCKQKKEFLLTLILHPAGATYIIRRYSHHTDCGVLPAVTCTVPYARASPLPDWEERSETKWSEVVGKQKCSQYRFVALCSLCGQKIKH